MSTAAPPPAARRRGRRRLVLVVLACMGLGVLLAGAAVAVIVRSLESNVERTEVFSGLDDDERPQAVPPVQQADADGLTLLVLGSDDREDDPIGREVADAPGGFHADGKRADTTLLVRLPADREGAWVVSIPRDSYVTLPPCRTEEGEQLPEREGQFGLAFRDGGLTCTVRAVEALSDVRIDHTVVVDFSGFTDMVGALGGVSICIEEPFRPSRVDLALDPGRHVLQGRDALEYVRARYGVDDGGDLARIERQKQFMAAMLDRARSRGMLLRPDRALRFASAATSSLQVDQDLDVRGLALSLREVDPAQVLFTTVPLDPEPGPQFAEGGSLFGRIKIDDAAAAELFAAFERDQLPAVGPPSPGTSPDTSDVPPPASPPGDTTSAAETNEVAQQPCR